MSYYLPAHKQETAVAMLVKECRYLADPYNPPTRPGHARYHEYMKLKGRKRK